MITQARAAQMLSEFENEVQRVGYETCDKRTLANLFGYLKIRCADSTLYGRADKLKACQALEQRWQIERKGSPILADHGEGIMGYDPAGTDRGAKTIFAILRELRGLLAELPITVQEPAPIVMPPMVGLGVSPAIPASITDAVDAAVAKALAARDAQKETVSV